MAVTIIDEYGNMREWQTEKLLKRRVAELKIDELEELDDNQVWEKIEEYIEQDKESR